MWWIQILAFKTHIILSNEWDLSNKRLRRHSEHLMMFSFPWPSFTPSVCPGTSLSFCKRLIKNLCFHFSFLKLLDHTNEARKAETFYQAFDKSSNCWDLLFNFSLSQGFSKLWNQVPQESIYFIPAHCLSFLDVIGRIMHCLLWSLNKSLC